MKHVWVFIFVLLLAACQAETSGDGIDDGSGTTSAAQGNTCPAERPQICPMIYMPVCASKQDGSRQQYASGCMACAEPEVQSYVDGGCSPL